MRYLHLIIVIVVIILAGCSSAGLSPVSSDLDRQANPDEINLPGTLPVGVSETFKDGTPYAGMGALGLFQIRIDPATLTGEVTSLRQNSLTDVIESVDVTNFLQLTPCHDCVDLKSICLDEFSNVVASIGIKHPFRAGDPLKPISGLNRADLHVFNIEGIVISNNPSTSFPGLENSVADFRLVNADGFTGYLDEVIDSFYATDATIHPYILHFDDYSAGNFDPSSPTGFESITEPPPSGNLVMAMGCDYDYQDYVLDIDGSFDFIFAVGCTYAISSASKIQRFSPEYRVPQHNKKAASEVTVEIIGNSLTGGDTSSEATLHVKVVDINHGIPVGIALNEMLADSSVSAVDVEVPGITSDAVSFSTTPLSGTGHDPSDPLVFEGVITNSAGGGSGTYSGLVKVKDSYTSGLNTSPLLNGKDGIKRVDPLINPLTGLFEITEFATYQTFKIDVIPAAQIEIISPNGGETLWMAMFHIITWDIGAGGIENVKIEWSTDDFTSDIRTIIDSTPNDGSFEWKPIPVENVTTGKIRISDVLGTSTDTSDDYFTIALPVWLGYEPEIIVDTTTVTWGGYGSYAHYFEEISPAISQDTDGMVHVMHYSLASGEYSRDSQVRSQNGTSWEGCTQFFGTTGEFYRDDYCKVAPSHDGVTWGCVNHYQISVGWYSDVDRMFGGIGYYCFDGAQATNTTSIKRYPEVATDQAGYVFMFGDGNVENQIVWNKTNQPGFISNGFPGQVTPVQQLTSDGIISKTRSWARQGEGVALIYYTSSGNIMLAETTDAPTNTTWDTTEIIWTPTGYSNVHTPSLCADSSGHLFATWTAFNTSLSRYEILASMREVVDGPWIVPTLVSLSANEYKDVHISSKPIAMPTGTTEDVAVVSWENSGTISAALCPMDLMLFLPETVASASGAVTKSPDGFCLDKSMGYQFDVLFAWSWQDGNWDIVLRNANLVTP
jgi:hypothetical protein